MDVERLDALRHFAKEFTRLHGVTEGIGECLVEIEALTADRDAWKARAERAIHELSLHGGDVWHPGCDPCDCWTDSAERIMRETPDGR